MQTDPKILEACFVFACVWACGGCLAVEKTTDHRALFSKYWVQEWKVVPFPDQVSTQKSLWLRTSSSCMMQTCRSSGLLPAKTLHAALQVWRVHTPPNVCDRGQLPWKSLLTPLLVPCAGVGV